MNANKSIAFTLLIFMVFGVSVCSFNSNDKSHSGDLKRVSNAAVSKKDSAFQNLINLYTSLKDSVELDSAKIVFITVLLKDYESEIKGLQNEPDFIKNNFFSAGLVLSNVNSDSSQKLNKKLIAKEDSFINAQMIVNAKIILVLSQEHEKQYSILKSVEARKKILSKQLSELTIKIKTYVEKLSGSRNFNYKGTSISIFVANIDSNDIRFHWKNKTGHIYGTIGNLFSDMKIQNITPLMITNGGMFSPGFSPQGLYIEDFKPYHSLDTLGNNPDLNFYLKPNGVFYIDSNNVAHIDTTERFRKLYNPKEHLVKYATQSGPMLVINGNIHKKFTQGSVNQKIRSGVGVMTDKKVVFIITNEPANFYEFASVFRDIFGCENALFLDGAISEMYLSDLNPTEKGGNFGVMISVSKKVKTK